MASLLLSVTTLLVYVEGKLLFSVKVGFVAALAFALSIGIAKLGTNANTEYFLALPMTAGLVAFTVACSRRQGSWYLLCGALNGVAILTKETALFPFAFLVLFEWISTAIRDQDRAVAVPRVGLMLLGAALSGAVAILPFVVAGAFTDLIGSGVIYTVEYVGDTPLQTRILETLLAPIPIIVVAGPWVILSVFAALRASRSSKPDKHWLLIGWATASVVGIAFAGRFYAHYYVQLLPGMSLLVPLGISRIRETWRQSRAVQIVSPLLITASVLVALLFALTVYGRSSLNSAAHGEVFWRYPRGMGDGEPCVSRLHPREHDEGRPDIQLGFPA